MNFDISINDYIPLICLLMVFFFSVMIIFTGGNGNWFEKIFNFFNDQHLSSQGRHEQYRRYDFQVNSTLHYSSNKLKKCQPHLHRWVFEKKEKHKWSFVNGKPTGARNNLDNIICITLERPGHTETKLETLINWRKNGFNVVFTSCNHWKCSICGETKQTEFYDNPIKEDPSTAPPLLTLNQLIAIADRNKRIQPIDTINCKQELAVESVKWYK